MLQQYAHEVTTWLTLHPEWGGIVTFIIAIAESLAIIGIFVPALIFFTAIGALVSSGVLPLYAMLIWAFAGAVIGDAVSFFIGYFYKERLQNIWPFNKYQRLFDRAKVFFAKHGGKSVFVCRFIGPLRAIMPLVAGIMNMKPRRFFIVNIAAALLWSPIYMSGGFILGFAAKSLSPHHGQHLTVVIGTALLIVTFIYLLLRLIIHKLHKHIHFRVMRFPTIRKIFFNAINFDHAQQTFLGLWGVVFLILFFAVLLSIISQFGLNHINNLVHHYFQADRNPIGDNFFLIITLFGQPTILYSWVGIMLVALLFKQHWRTAKHLLGLACITALSTYFIKVVTHYPRPGGLVNGPHNFSFPSVHITVAIIVYGFFSYIVLEQFEKHHHRWALITVSIMVFAIAVSRLYLGVHWFSDIIGSILLGLVLLLMFIISYRRKATEKVDQRWFIPLLISSFIIIYGLYAWQNYAMLLQNYQILAPHHMPVLLPGPVLV